MGRKHRSGIREMVRSASNQHPDVARETEPEQQQYRDADVILRAAVDVVEGN
jgi:hypothetical protein